MAESLAKPRSDDVYDSECSNILHEFCERKTRGQEPFVIPYISIPELDKYISKLDNKKCTCIMYFPDVWSVVLSANMSQATEIFVTRNGRSLIKNTKQNRL